MLFVLIGALGGLSATGPMTVLMELLHRRLPIGQRHPLPPREITNYLESEATTNLDRPAKAAFALLNHFAYGTAVGAIFGALGGRRAKTGILYGALVWLVSYGGLLPGCRILKPIQDQSPNRNVLMLVVHILWGSILGLFIATLSSDWKTTQGALVSQAEPDRDRKS